MWTCTVTPDDGLPLGAIGPSDTTMVTVGSDCLLNGMVLYLPFDNGGLTDQGHFVHSVIAELSSSTADRYQIHFGVDFIPDVNSRLLINSSPDLTFSMPSPFRCMSSSTNLGTSIPKV